MFNSVTNCLSRGKIDVREAAARLPDEPDLPEPGDEPEAESDVEAADADDPDEPSDEAPD